MPKEQKISGTVTEAEIVAANAAIQAYGFFRQMQGACYRSAIFVRLYLKETHGIEYEYQGKRTDLALAHPDDPSRTPPGPLVIHGVTAEPGHVYSYHDTVPEIGQEFIEKFKSHPVFAQILRAQAGSHAEAFACANDDALSRAYLDNAPDGWGYQKIVDFIRERPRQKQA
jgi:hypothetical protein